MAGHGLTLAPGRGMQLQRGRGEGSSARPPPQETDLPGWGHLQRPTDILAVPASVSPLGETP